MKKLIMHIIDTRIGLKSIYFIGIAIFLNSCGLFGWDEDYDYYYRIMIYNTTSDTLILTVNDTVLSDFLNYELLPESTVHINDGRNLNEGQDVIKVLYTDGKHEYYSVVSVFKNNNNLVTWKGPSFIKPDSIHHFFNYSSWDHWLIDENEGIVQFTIYKSDIQDN